LKSSDLETSLLKQGVKLKNSNLDYDFTYDLFDFIIYDLDENENTTNDQIRANGKIYFNVNFEIDFDFEKKTFNFKSGMENLNRMELEAELTNYKIDISREIVKHKFKPITFFLPTQPPFPIILRPIIHLYTDTKGEIDAELRAIVEQTNSLNASVSYDNGWTYSKNFSENFTFDVPNASLNANMKNNLGSELTILLYDFIGPTIQVGPYLKLNVNTNSNPWLELFGGIDGKVWVNSSKIGMGISDYEKDIINYEKKLLELFKNQNNTFTDPRDGQVYDIVKIGNQEMFAENLNYNSSGSFYYNNDPNYSGYGKLYNWNSAISVCPPGWHLPSDDEFKELEIFLGMSQDEVNQKSANRGANEEIGTKLKKDGSSGFEGILSGHRTATGNYLNFGYNGYFWTSTKDGSSSNPYNRILWKDLTGVERDDYIFGENYFSVRCFKDE